MKIILEYDEKDSSMFVVSVEDGPPNPYQLLALGSYFEFEGKYQLSEIRAAEKAEYMRRVEQNKIATPQAILRPK